MDPRYDVLGCMILSILLSAQCCVLERGKDVTSDGNVPVTIVATMGATVKLLGRLETKNLPFYKDNQAVFATEHIYEVKVTLSGYQVIIRFLTCTDEGEYRIGAERFTLTVKARECGMFYYTAKVDKVTKAALIKPLRGVIRISKLYVERDNSGSWSLIQVWNNTMSRTESPAHCCFMVDKGNTFGGYGDTEYQHFMYQRHGQPGQSCADVNNSVVVPQPEEPQIPHIRLLEDVDTRVDLIDVKKSTQDIKKKIDEFELMWNSAADVRDGMRLVTTIMLMYIICL